MQNFSVKLEREGTNLYLVFPYKVSDVTLHWRQMFDLGNAFGNNAYRMNAFFSDPAQDEAEAGFLKVVMDGEFVTLLMRDPTDRLGGNKNVVLLMAERICEAATQIAEKELARQGK